MGSRRIALSLLLFCGLGLTAWLVGCSAAPDPWEGKPTPHILVTVPPLYSFAKSVAGEQGAVQCLCTETGPHHYEYSATDLRLLRGATCFLSIGLGLDDKFSDALVTTRPDVPRLVFGDLLPAKLKLNNEHGGTDPHVWNGTPQAIQMVELIRDELQKVDAAHQDDYGRNAAAYLKELHQLHDEGLALLKGKRNPKIISFHESLDYFAKEFGIDIVDVIEDFPGNESDVSKIRKLANECVAKDIHVIAVEPQYPTTTAASLLRDEVKKASQGKIDLQLVEVDPLETATEQQLTADLYVKTMRENLENLAKSLR